MPISQLYVLSDTIGSKGSQKDSEFELFDRVYALHDRDTSLMLLLCLFQCSSR
jgi:hypothetical protein